MKYKYLLIGLFSLLNLGCRSQSKNNQEIQHNINACEIKQDINKHLEVIKNNARDVLNGRDDCVLDLLDTLTNKFISSSEVKYLEAFYALCQASDGYVGEVLGGHSMRMTLSNPKDVFSYFKNNDDMLKSFAGYISFEFYVGGAYPFTYDEYHKRLDSSLANYSKLEEVKKKFWKEIDKNIELNKE